MADPVGRVSIAFDDDMLTASPTWHRIDDLSNNLVSGIDIHRGRQSERDQTDTGTATVYLNDTTGLFDPANSGSTYFGKLDGKQIALQLWNPVTSAWVCQFVGTIDDYGYDLRPSQVVSNVQIECVDMFDYLGGAEMAPGIAGNTPPAGSERVVFYEDAHVDDRIIQLLTDAGISSSRWVVFTGNVRDQETRYEPGDVFLQAIRDAADSEFPGIANCYVDKTGRFVFHGREARFDPDTVAAGATPGAWNFTRWKIGDGAAIALDSDRAQVRALAYNRARADIINAAIAYPRGIKDAAMPGQVVTDATSITKYGIHSWSAPDLITLEGTTTLNDANAETKLFSQFYVQNLKDPRNRIRTLGLKAISPADPRASATWALLCGVDISDIVNIKVGYPGGTGINAEDFYVEGSDMQIRPLNPDHDMVDLALNVSPAAWYTTDVFTIS